MTLFVSLAFVALQAVMPGQVAAAPARLKPATTGSAVIRGRIVRGDGRPLPRALLTLTRLDLPGIPRRAESDDEGRFELSELPAGSYRLSVMRVGYDTIEYGQRRASERGEPIVLAPDEIRERVDLALPRTGAVAGRIVDESGEPVEGASVRIEQVGYVVQWSDDVDQAQGNRTVTGPALSLTA